MLGDEDLAGLTEPFILGDPCRVRLLFLPDTGLPDDGGRMPGTGVFPDNGRGVDASWAADKGLAAEAGRLGSLGTLAETGLDPFLALDAGLVGLSRPLDLAEPFLEEVLTA